VSTLGTLLVGVAIAVGLVGIVLPILPGTLLILGAIIVWCVVEGSTFGWVVGGLAVAFIAGSQVLKYAIPSKHLRSGGIPSSTLLAGAVLGIVGFFVIPVIGLVIGFVLGIYVAELARADDRSQAWPSTKLALRAVGVSILIELAGGLLAAAAWAAGVVAT
jgi:uncharacterized protein YqgC (DUF456 family)